MYTRARPRALSNKAINELPLNGRDFENLVVLRPGVSRYPGGGIGSISSNGIRPEDNNFVVDGIDNNDFSVTLDSARALPEAVQEVQVQTTSYSAEFGRSSGAQFSVVNILFHGCTPSMR